MSVFLWIIFSTLAVSFISFAGVFILFLKEQTLNKIILVLVAFSAGALMGAAFFNLLPEAGFSQNVFLYLILGFCAFFILEQFIKWHHHHVSRHPEIAPFSYLILISDGLHNFIDGLIIAGSFLASVPVGLVATLAVILHEIPQEIGDFGVLIYGGVKRTMALFLNFLSAVVSVLGGILGFFILEKIAGSLSFILAFAAGTFLYISAADLIPQIKQEGTFRASAIYFLIFMLGIALIWLLTGVLA